MEIDNKIKTDNNEILKFDEYNFLSFARHCKYLELEALLIKGLNPDSKDEFGNTILIIGAQNGNKRIIKLALRYGAQINNFNYMGNTALHFTNEYKFYDLSEYLIKKGANPNVKNLRGLQASEGIRKVQGKKNVHKITNEYKSTVIEKTNNQLNKSKKPEII